MSGIRVLSESARLYQQNNNNVMEIPKSKEQNTCNTKAAKLALQCLKHKAYYAIVTLHAYFSTILPIFPLAYFFVFKQPVLPIYNLGTILGVFLSLN